MLIPLWARLAAGVALSGAVAFGGYKIGAWKEEAAGLKALATCTADLAKQRETDLTGANHALADQLQDATALVAKDADALAELTKRTQDSALAFGKSTRALYETAVGSCNFTSDFVSVLAAASRTANRDGADAEAPAGKAAGGNGSTPKIPKPTGKPAPAR